ncbi:MAG: hypothetical protein ACYC96_02020 [Fimbriimonadaceae bacterium]
MQSSLSSEQAVDDLRAIRETMDRSVRYSNFAGLSGLVGGVIALIGVVTETRSNNTGAPFLVHWLVVIAAALTFDFVWTSRRVRNEDKAVVKRLVRRMAVAALPGLGAGLGYTLAFVAMGRTAELFPYWMLSYGVAMSAVGLMAPRQVRWLAGSFLVSGALALAIQTFGVKWIGMPAFALSFGLFHCAYGVFVGVTEGW